MKTKLDPVDWLSVMIVGALVLALCISISAAFAQPAQPQPPTQAEIQGRMQAFATLLDRATNESVILAGQIAELRKQLDDARKQCPAPVKPGPLDPIPAN